MRTILFITNLLLVGCAGTYIKYAPADGKPVNLVEDKIIVRSDREHSRVYATLFKDFDNYLKIYLAIINQSDSSINFDPEDEIRLTELNDTGHFRVAVYFYTDMVKKIRKDRSISLVSAYLCQGIEQANAGLTKTNFNANVSTGSGQAPYNLKGQVNSVDYAQKAELRQIHEGEIDKIEEDYSTKVSTAKEIYLKANTILPGNSISGFLFADCNRGFPESGYTLEVRVGGQIHEFNFRQKPGPE